MSVEQPSSLPDMYIVSRSCLVELLQVCALCSSRETSVQLTTMGSLARATVTCVSGHRRQWNSQPLVHEKPAGNIAMCSAILFSGSSITKSLRLFDIMGIARIHRSQYFEYQKCYLFPAIQNVWEKEQAAVTEKLEGRPLHLAGDARCDSPGHTALHGTYTVMETTVNRIVHFEVVKATTVSSSYCMEQKGLELCLDYIATKGMEVNTLVTDRHSQVKAFLRNKHPHISHRFDVWHVAKGIKKKIAAVSQSKKHQVLRLWCESIIRHLYWCARTSDNGELLLAKWETVVRHAINVHSHPNSLHPVCFHGDLGEREWLHEGTETYKKLHDILLAKQLVKDIPQLSSAQQTFGLETFHAVLIHFAPKSYSFSDQGMVARTALAALHYNANADRIAQVRDGVVKHRLKPSKVRKTWIAVPVKEDALYTYTDDLKSAVYERIALYPSFRKARAALVELSLPTRSSSYGERPELSDVLDSQYSRF
ncbi:uncharacterized protein LOC135384273 [Ornithodoros turicata]|uniref:uncharacterized protein LOC135384273 n=1 Tax=Ornithodoros turicata TaxID=34597 RepID=UPI0031386CD3